VADSTIQDVLNQGFTPRHSLELLLDEALACGGRDNITGVLLTLNDPCLPMPAAGEALDLVHPGSRTHTRGIWGRLLRFFRGGAS
jgi:hypothetical protein